MTTKEKNAVEEHLLKKCGFHQTTKQYKLIQLLFKKDELDFLSVNYDDAIHLRKELWFLGFECGMRWNKIIISEDMMIKYYETVMGMMAEPRQPEKSFDDKKPGI